ncbi:MAG: hypothetical protein M1536_08105 [Firmicutes bacterium]|nr:hypothetical protein [Bacillota bacterium]
MKYNAVVKEIHPCGCTVEGDVLLDLNGLLFRCYYQMDEKYALKYFVEDSIVAVDLWLRWGYAKKIDTEKRIMSKFPHVGREEVLGQAEEIFNENEFRLKSEIDIDVELEQETTDDFAEGDYLLIQGTYQAYSFKGLYDRFSPLGKTS